MKSAFPYLVDIGIGTYCPFSGGECPVPCYTSAVNDGDYAESYFLYSTLKDALQKANVFEVVFGGSEPTLYQRKDASYAKLSYILESYHNAHFKVGITTRNYNWHKMDDFPKAVKFLDTMAISANRLEDLPKAKLLNEKVHEVGKWNTAVYLQTILGLYPWEETIEFLRQAKENWFYKITLLGYKEFGFGTQQKPHPLPDSWIKEVKELGVGIGIDSILVNKYRQKLIEHGIEPHFLVGAEGESTCYVDAARMQMAASSFTTKTVPIDECLDSKRFLEIFEGF